MAEVEMEVDTAPQFGVDTHVDDEIIDFGPDTEKQSDCPREPDFFNTQMLRLDERKDLNGDNLHDFDDLAGHDHPETVDVNIEGESLAKSNDLHRSSHEIDYDPEDSANFHAEADAPEMASSATGELQPDKQSNMHDPVKEDSERREEDHEISWEHEYEHEKIAEIASEDDHHSVADSCDNQTAQTVSVLPETVNAEQAPKQHEPKSDVADDSDVVHNEDLDAKDANEYENMEADDARHEDSGVDTLNFPAITVQYKGEEYPCFSTNSDGFFSEISILDQSMKSLLDGFREELINELLAEDELVFQVDELGLEFSELSAPDILANTTFRQIIEVFDILSKNQDPENTRTIYTNLFTRPNTSKRLDFLMESAAEGKGLDEVIHLFQSPMPGAVGLGDMFVAEDVETQFDEPESAVEESTNDSNQVSEILEPSGQVDELETDDHVLPNQPGSVSDSHPDLPDEFQHPEEVAISLALVAEDDVGDGQEEGEEEVFADSRKQLIADDANDTSVTLEYQEEFAADIPLANKSDKGEVDSKLGVDFDENGLAEAVPRNIGYGDIGKVNLDEAQNDANGFVDATKGSTTTLTQRDQREVVSAEYDTIDDGVEEYIVEEATGDENIDEIDWQDDVGTLHDEEYGDVSPSNPKRPRGDDENSPDTDMSAKRRRP